MSFWDIVPMCVMWLGIILQLVGIIWFMLDPS
jgi:hypothetical protein